MAIRVPREQASTPGERDEVWIVSTGNALGAMQNPHRRPWARRMTFGPPDAGRRSRQLAGGRTGGGMHAGWVGSLFQYQLCSYQLGSREQGTVSPSLLCL